MPATLDLREALARRVTQESGKARQELAIATFVRPTRTHLVLAITSQTAPAKRATGAPMEARAQRAMQEHTRAQQEHLCALNVWQGSIL